MLRIAVNTLINRPVQDVWDFFIDLTNSPRWTRSGSELRQTSEGPLGVGATIESVRPIFGREIKSQTIVVTQYEPGHLIAYAAAIPLLGHTTGGFTFESVGGGTRLSRWGELELGRAEGLLGPILARVLRGGWGTEMSNQKRLIEARP
jgi:Polyketide cyclase / dehydrase and lipid transport.